MKLDSGCGSAHALHSVLPRARPSASLCQPRRQSSFYQRATQLLSESGPSFNETSSRRVKCRRCTAPHTAQPTLSDTNQPPEQRDNPLQRILSGLLLAILGSLSIYAGGVLFTGKPYTACNVEAVPVIRGLSLDVLIAGLVCLCSYQVCQVRHCLHLVAAAHPLTLLHPLRHGQLPCQEFYGFVISKGIAEGSQPPPQGVTVFISLLCTSLALFTYLSKGRSTAALAVATFAVLSLQLITSERIGISELGLTALGLVYCGKQYVSLVQYAQHAKMLLESAVPDSTSLQCRLPAVVLGEPAIAGHSIHRHCHSWTAGECATSLSCGAASHVAADQPMHLNQASLTVVACRLLWELRRDGRSAWWPP